METQCTAFFHTDDGEVFTGNDAARGPWSEDACHAGPVTALIARALERCIPEQQLMRLSVELIRPVPMAGIRITTAKTKTGRAVSSAKADMYDLNGKLVAKANSLHMVQQDLGEVPTLDFTLPSFEQSVPGPFPITKTMHSKPSFSSGTEVRYPPGENIEPGPTTLWMKTINILDGEEPTPFQRLCPLADCGNGISRNSDLGDLMFMNPDITIAMHRAPTSEWIGSSAKSFWQPNGMGLAQAQLFDREGPIASVMQTLLLQRSQ
ncbi:MAG: thioesterase family protein [Pseudomonadota bacterium]|nr:thioesterase family protein [Pseudomonadota bacterium]